MTDRTDYVTMPSLRHKVCLYYEKAEEKKAKIMKIKNAYEKGYEKNSWSGNTTTTITPPHKKKTPTLKGKSE